MITDENGYGVGFRGGRWIQYSGVLRGRRCYRLKCSRVKNQRFAVKETSVFERTGMCTGLIRRRDPDPTLKRENNEWSRTSIPCMPL